MPVPSPPAVPRDRLRVLRDVPANPSGAYVLHWMTAARRTRWNHALDRAVALAREHRRGLLVLEGIRCDHPHASPRFHRFVLDGMADQARRFAAAGVAYHPFVEREPGGGRGLLAALASRAVAVVTDDAPVFFLPRMLAAAAGRIPARLEAVDGAGLLPAAAVDRAPATAFAFRRRLQAVLPAHLAAWPSEDPLRAAAGLPRAAVPRAVARRWPAATERELSGASTPRLPTLDAAVGPVALRGGEAAGAAALERFLGDGLARYGARRNDPAEGGGSGLSPYLHFGHVGAHQVLDGVLRACGRRGVAPGPRATGARRGWWGLPDGAEAFLDQAIVWRELGFAFARHRADHADYASLPEWARRTLDAHRADPRAPVYDRATLDAAATHDEVWNAAQRQLRREGRIHNYLRMLWGKKVIEWSPAPEVAWATLHHLNDRWALDGRDPNTSTGIAWCFGRFDRPWGPERAVFGTVRWMSTESTRRKFRLDAWLRRHGPEERGRS